MEKEVAKRAIFKLLPEYAKSHNLKDKAAGLTFYAWLTKNHPDLVRFTCRGTPNQQVKIWVEEYKQKNLIE